MRKLTLLIVVLLAQFSLGQAKTTVSGKVLGNDKTPMAMAHVHLLRMLQEEPVAAVAVDADGRYSLPVVENGLYRIQFTGVGHKLYEMPLLVNTTKPILLDARLAPNQFRLDSVMIIGDFNNFAFRNPQPMTRQANGTYVAEFDSKEKEFAYQIMGTTDGHSVNGTMADSYIYDGGGDYRSIVKVKDGRARIVFDPAVVNSPKATVAEVLFRDSRSLPARFAQVSADMKERRARFMAAANEYRASGKDMKTFSYDWSAELVKLARSIRGETDPLLRQAFYMSYIDLTTLRPSTPIDTVLMQAATNMIPPNSPLLAMNPTIMESGFRAAGNVKGYDAYLTRVLAENPDMNVKGALLFNGLQDAYYSRNQEQSKLYYNRITQDFAGTQWAEMASRFSPDRAVIEGKPVPAFRFVSLDNPSVTYTAESMKGKYYMIDFWATWCGPCIAEMDNLHKAYEKYHGRNFEILSLSFDEKPETVGLYRAKKYKMPWAHGFVEGNFKSDIARTFEVTGIPKPILVDPNGNIVAMEVDLRGENLDATLARFLGPAAN
jgi:thiol-disulfide isomerase/thioredoxin